MQVIVGNSSVAFPIFYLLVTACCLCDIKELTEKMLEIVGITSLDIQREIITCIPEVLDDAEHSEVARELR